MLSFKAWSFLLLLLLSSYGFCYGQSVIVLIPF